MVETVEAPLALFRTLRDLVFRLRLWYAALVPASVLRTGGCGQGLPDRPVELRDPRLNRLRVYARDRSPLPQRVGLAFVGY